MTDLIELAERCEQASGSDRELDVLIGVAVDFRIGKMSLRERFEVCGLADTVDAAANFHGDILRTGLPAFTTSIDAAMSLVPEGWRIIQVSHTRSDEPVVVTVATPFALQHKSGRGPDWPRAILAAALRAKALVSC